MNSICQKYVNMIYKYYGNIISSIIIYGSNIYDCNNSDLDVCLIVKNCNDTIKKDIIEQTIEFHKQNDLYLDDEIPFINKLIYTELEVEEVLNNPPFYKNGVVVINDIVKSKEFLNSKEMKQRLLLNILTTDHLTIGKSTTLKEMKAFKIMLNVIIEYYHLNNYDENEILECLYRNKYTGSEGEMYLGYKKNNEQKEKYLKIKINEIINNRLGR